MSTSVLRLAGAPAEVLQLRPPSFDLVRDEIYTKALTKGQGVYDGMEFVLAEGTPLSLQTDEDCTANACSDGFEISRGLDAPDEAPVQISRRFAYAIGRAWQGDTLRNTGTFLGYMLAQFSNMGAVPEYMWDYLHDVNEAPDFELYKVARANRLGGSYEVKRSGSFVIDLVNILLSQHVLVFAIDICDEFQHLRHVSDNASFIAKPTTPITGRHAMILVGFRVVNGQYQFLLRNSWGSSFGLLDRPGHMWISSDYLNSSLCDETFMLSRNLKALSDR